MLAHLAGWPGEKYSAPLAGIPALRYRDPSLPGWPGFHVVTKLIFVAFNRRAEILQREPARLNGPARLMQSGPKRIVTLLSRDIHSDLQKLISPCGSVDT